MPRRPFLRALAERVGILSEYAAAGSGARRRTSDATRVALLAVLGFDASDERAARRALEALGPERPPEPAVAGVSCVTAQERLGRRRVFGIWANLYSVRSERGCGFGDLGELRRLIRFAGDAGAAFVGVNPLHALRNLDGENSPYAPLSRLFRNPLYLDLEAVPELAACRPAQRLLASGATRRASERLRSATHLDYAGAAALQRPVLEALSRCFASARRKRRSARGRAYAAYLARSGSTLDRFAEFLALDDHFAAMGRARDWRAWPAAYRDPSSDAVRAFARSHAQAIELHRFVQFELDRQLGAAAADARKRGLPLGLYQDLALGSAASGFDPWGFPDSFVTGVSVGAPPDVFNPAGQDWGFPPLDPHRLAADDYRYFRLLLQAGFAHAGALRIDHVMGLFRQWWIPAGEPPSAGAYVRFPAGALLSILAEQSRRHGALAIGEDLGTVPRGLPSQLARRGVMSSRVLFFERDSRGSFRPASRYSRRALVTANTHDLPTLAAFWSGRDLEIQRELGLLGDRQLGRARSQRAGERRALLRRLRADGLLRRGDGQPAYPELCGAVHAFLCRTPAPLVALSLDDLAGETEPINVPGLGADRYPSWTRRMGTSLDVLARGPVARTALRGARSRRR